MNIKAKDYNINIGEFKKGKLNQITDVKGVKVGHCTVCNSEDINTGVTVILPSEDNIYLNKYIAGCDILNGFGKTQGLIELMELGVLESPIALTNTLNVGLVHDAIVEYMIKQCSKDNIYLKTFNPIVGECNDSFLNDIQKRSVKKNHVFEAIKNAKIKFEEGDVGAGKGMSCYKLKGGIGSASRVLEINNKNYTVGILVLSNYGLTEDLMINNNYIGKKIAKELEDIGKKEEDKGSIISIIATDIPMTSRQLNRAAKRASVGIARMGSFIGHGSGEIAIAFSTANKIKNEEVMNIKAIGEKNINKVFRAIGECEQEAILNSMLSSNDLLGFDGNERKSLRNYMDKYI